MTSTSSTSWWIKKDRSLSLTFHRYVQRSTYLLCVVRCAYERQLMYCMYRIVYGRFSALVAAVYLVSITWIPHTALDLFSSAMLFLSMYFPLFPPSFLFIVLSLPLPPSLSSFHHLHYSIFIFSSPDLLDGVNVPSERLGAVRP